MILKLFTKYFQLLNKCHRCTTLQRELIMIGKYSSYILYPVCNVNKQVYSIVCKKFNPSPSPCYAPIPKCKTHKEINYKYEGLSQSGISFSTQKFWWNPSAMVSLRAHVMTAWFQELVIELKAFCGPSTERDFTSHAMTCRFNSVSWSSSHFGHLTVKTAL